MRKFNNDKALVVSGTLNLEEGTITETQQDSQIVWKINELARSFDNKDVSFVIREINKESVHSYEFR